MKIATLLFTYNRSEHTKRVVNSLKNNTVMPQKLFIFQDGLKEGEEEDEWRKVSDVVHTIDWCDNEIILSDYNKGLAESIVSGVGLAFQTYDAVIVLEDDCVAAPGFIQFMVQCFEKYEENKNIYSVSGYSWPIDLNKTDSDIYFCGRTSSWGWGTWKDRWNQYIKDYSLYKQLKGTKEGSLNLAMWASDLESALISSVTGKSDIWGLFWVLRVIAEKGLCINPFKSLIQNVGLDGTGVNCGISGRYDVEIDRNIKKEYRLSDEIQISHDVERSFAGLFGSYTAVNEYSREKEKILVYGLGRMFFRNEKKINESYYIEAFIDNKKPGYYAGKKVFKANKLVKQYQYDKILVMIYDRNECAKISKQLVCELGVDVEKIEMGYKKYSV